MRICFAINNLGAGGAERVLSTLANSFAKDNNFKVIAICFKRPYIYDHFYNFADNIELYLVESRTPDEIQDILIKTKPAVVISFLNPMNYLMSLATQRTGIPHITCERNNPYFSPTKENRKAERDYAFAHAKGCVFQTENALSYFKNKISGIYQIIPNAIILDTKPQLKKLDTKHKIVTIGRYIEQKNYPFILKAFAKLKLSYNNYILECYGKDSGDLSIIKQLASQLNLTDSVVFYEQQKDLHERIKEAHFFVSGSEYEGMSNALSEAAALGLPCICTDIPGNRELVEKYKFGLFVPPNDVEALTKAMERLINDKSLCNHLSNNGLEMYSSRKWDKIFPIWKNFIFQVINY